ncbi:MAG: hypothetical protein ACT6WE_16870 [Shinella sp.]
MHPLIPWTPKPNPALGERKILITAGRTTRSAPSSDRSARRLASGPGGELALHDGGHEVRQQEIKAIAAFLADLV